MIIIKKLIYFCPNIYIYLMKNYLLSIFTIALFSCSNIENNEQPTNNDQAAQTVQVEPQTVEEFVAHIKTNTHLMEMAKEKAQSRGVSLDEMIKLDAEWLYNEKMKNTPDGQIKVNMERIKADSAWMAIIIKQAAELKISVEENIKLNAEYAYSEDQKKKLNEAK